MCILYRYCYFYNQQPRVINFMKSKTHYLSAQNLQSTKASLEKISQLSGRHYKQAMKHVQRFNKLETERKAVKQQVDPECTFKPKSYTQSYHGFAKKKPALVQAPVRKPELRLAEWGKQKDHRQRQNFINETVKISSKIGVSLTSSAEKKPTSRYLQNHIKRFNMTQSHSLTKNTSRLGAQGFQTKSKSILYSAPGKKYQLNSSYTS